MRKIITLFAALAAVAVAQAGSAKVADISTDALKQAIADGTVTVIDVNGTKSYNKGHIPTAVNFQAVKSDLATVLPKDKADLVVAYCANKNCGAYQQAVTAAVALGYTNVIHYSGGIEGWKDAGETVEKG